MYRRKIQYLSSRKSEWLDDAEETGENQIGHSRGVKWGLCLLPYFPVRLSKSTFRAGAKEIIFIYLFINFLPVLGCGCWYRAMSSYNKQIHTKKVFDMRNSVNHQEAKMVLFNKMSNAGKITKMESYTNIKPLKKIKL